MKGILKNYLYIYVYIYFRAAPAAYGSSQARGQIGAAAAILYHNHSIIRFESRLPATL